MAVVRLVGVLAVLVCALVVGQGLRETHVQLGSVATGAAGTAVPLPAAPAATQPPVVPPTAGPPAPLLGSFTGPSPRPVPSSTPYGAPLWPSAPPGEAFEFGRITDEDGAPLAGVVVRLEPWGVQSTTDSDGRYELKGMAVSGRCVWGAFEARVVGRSLTRFNEPFYSLVGQREIALRTGAVVEFVGPPRSAIPLGRTFCQSGTWIEPRS